MQETVRVEAREGWRRLVLNRPERLNAFTPAMQAALKAALEAAGADPSCRAVLLTGEGRGFCAGQSLEQPVGPDADLGRMLEEGYAPLIRALRDLPVPVVCAVNGVAAGAGANLALACDIVLAARSASFSQAFVKIGLIPDCGGTFFLPRLVGTARARALALLGDPIGAEQAAEWGMIWKAVPDEALMPEAEAIAARLAAGPARALALIKSAFADREALDAQLALEATLQREAGRSKDFAEGVCAFLEKRPPVFRGGR